MKGYTDNETRLLLDMAENAGRNGASLSAVFADFALKTGRAKGSVRNYYYQLVKKAASSGDTLEKFPALKGVSVQKNVAFTRDEEQNLLSMVEEGVKKGKSVRRTIFEMAGGDVRLALRYQNKYRNIKKVRQNTLTGDKDLAYKELSDKINALFDRVGASLRNENAKLKERVRELTEENRRLKTNKGRGVITEYFLSRPDLPLDAEERK